MADRQLPLAADAFADTVLLSSTVAIVAVDLEGRVILWNRGATRLFGWSEEEATGRFLPFMPPEREDEYMEILGRLRDGEAFDELRMPHMTRSGRRSELAVSLRGLDGSDGGRQAVVGVAHEFGDPARAEQLLRRIESLELRLSETHLPPHFLLNSLHAIGVLVREKRSDEAIRALADVGDILRGAVRGVAGEEVPLEREIELAHKYVGVERARLGGAVELEVAVEPGARRALVPELLLQPLVENALHHGLAPAGGGGTVTLRARVESGTVELTVEDDGAGLPEGWAPDGEPGVGLRGTRSRLQRMYGDEGRLRLEATARGARATVRLPLRTGEADRVRAS